MSDNKAPVGARRERPHMRNYGIAEDDEGLLLWDWVETRLVKARNYWVATASSESVPHAAPVWGLWHEGKFYFGSEPTARKSRDIAANPLVSLHLESGDEVVIVNGTVSLSDDLDLSARLAPIYGAKYPPFAPDASQKYYVVTPSVVLAWVEVDFPTTATRWTFDVDDVD